MIPIELGNHAAGSVLDFIWNTWAYLSGLSVTRTTNGIIRVYKGNDVTQLADGDANDGITDTEDFDAVTGMHHCRIDTSINPTFYAAGNDFNVCIVGGIWDGSTHNNCIARFRLEKGFDKVDVMKIDGLAGAATKLKTALGTEITAAAAAGTLSTTQMTTTLTETRDDQYNGATLIFTSGVLTGVRTVIQDYNGTSKMLTFTAVATAPTAGDTFIIV